MRLSPHRVALLVAALFPGMASAAPYPAVEKGQGLFIDVAGQRVFSESFQSTASFIEGLAFVKIKGETCVIDLNGQVLFKLPGFDAGGVFHEGLALVVNAAGKWGVIDTQGKLVVPAVFDSLGGFCEGLSTATTGQMTGFINRDGSWRVTPQFHDAGTFAEGRASVRIDNKYGFIDSDGRVVVKAEFKDVNYFAQGLAPVQVGLQWGYIDMDGAMAIPPRFDSASPFQEGLATVEVDGLYGAIDARGKMVVAPKFLRMSRFSQGRAGVCLEGKWGFIDLSGKMVIPPLYDQVDEFQDGLAHVIKKSDHGEVSSYIDRRGKTVFPQPVQNENPHASASP